MDDIVDTAPLTTTIPHIRPSPPSCWKDAILRMFRHQAVLRGRPRFLGVRFLSTIRARESMHSA
jgi:hypothetical protein